jgi:general secretion pathway protein G
MTSPTSRGFTAHRHGFTLIEIMTVVVIIGVLMSVVVVAVQHHLKEGRRTAAQLQVKNLSTALDTFEMHNGFLPSTEQGLTALITQPPSAPSWRGPYLDPPVLKPDPWGSPYVYKYPGERYPQKYDVSSPGPDRIAGNDDDIGNWQ